MCSIGRVKTKRLKELPMSRRRIYIQREPTGILRGHRITRQRGFVNGNKEGAQGNRVFLKQAG